MDMNFHFEISVTSQPFWDWIDLKGAKFKLPWFSSPSFIANTRVVILILDLINEVRNRLENQQKSWLKYYLSNISWAISKRGVHILILHFQEVGWWAFFKPISLKEISTERHFATLNKIASTSSFLLMFPWDNYEFLYNR